MLMPVFMSNLNPTNFWLPVNFRVLGMGLRALRSITQVKSRNIVVLTIIPRGLVNILNLGERNFFLPNKGQLIGNFFEVLLSKSQKLGGATA